jgi:hypothetical protein
MGYILWKVEVNEDVGMHIPPSMISCEYCKWK